MDNQYFASMPGPELSAELEARFDRYITNTKQSGILSKIEQSEGFYYGDQMQGYRPGGSQIKRGGEQGEKAALTVNDYRNLLRHVLVMTTSNRLALDVRAVNSDLKSMQQAKLGNQIMDDYLKQKRWGRHMYRAAEMALVTAKGYVIADWDPSLGKPYSTEIAKDKDGQPILKDNGQPLEKVISDGDLRIRAAHRRQVFHDEYETDFANLDWYTFVELGNKFTYAARYPQLREQILALTPYSQKSRGTWWNQVESDTKMNDSMVEVYRFVHKRTEAMPNGRMLISCGQGTECYDGPTPYDDKLNCFRIVPGEVMGSTEAYSDFFDVLGIQEALNTLWSTAFTNQQAGGVNLVYCPDAVTYSKEELAKGLVILKGPPGMEPKPITLTNTPAEIFKLIEMLDNKAESLSGMNSAARGNPEASLKSGFAISLVQAMAVQFNSGFQQEWAGLHEDVGSFALWCLKKFAKSPRFIALGGKHNRSAMKSFVGADLESIDRVVCDLGNPLSRTIAGRLDLADKFLDKGMVSTPQEYVNVLETGRLDPLIEGKSKQIDRIRMENEALMDGQPAHAMVTDSHLLDVQEHAAVMNDPELRARATQGDPLAQKILQNVINHIQEHKELYQTQDPFFSVISGEPPSPQPPMGPPPGGPMGPPGPGGDMGPPPPDAGPGGAPSDIPPSMQPPGPPPPGARPPANPPLPQAM